MMKNAGSGKYTQIAEALKADIDKGLYKPGESIPTIRNLAARYGCSPQTVNKATAWLSQQGYLESRQGSGSVVSYQKPEIRRNRPILIDTARSHHLSSMADPDNYRCRDIYLAYLLQSAETGSGVELIVYDKQNPILTPEFEIALRGSSGFLVQGSLPDEWTEALAFHNTPTVFINRPLPELSKGRFGTVIIDEEPLDDLANYFASLGHQNILFAFSEELERTAVLSRRLRRFEEALNRAFLNRPYKLEIFAFNPRDPKHGRTFGEFADKGFRAAFGFNDISALRLISMAREIGLSVPEDFSVAGFDDLFPSTLSSPPLTTITVDRSALVEHSINLLNRLMNESEPASLSEILPTRLQIRQSCFRCP